MSLDVKKQCLLCAWRETCSKKFTIKESSLHCPDYCRDRTLAAGQDDDAAPAERHKQVVDVFGSS